MGMEGGTVPYCEPWLLPPNMFMPDIIDVLGGIIPNMLPVFW